MAKKQRRTTEEFSLSFLDVICCGFGAVILLLMITKTVQPQIIEASTVNLDGKVAELEEQLYEIRGETVILNRDLNAKHEQLSEYEERIAILRGQLASARSRHASRAGESESAVSDESGATRKLSMSASSASPSSDGQSGASAKSIGVDRSASVNNTT